jgi:hypothetical protein
MPFDEAQDAYRTFKTYSNYVLSADLIIQQQYGPEFSGSTIL